MASRIKGLAEILAVVVVTLIIMLAITANQVRILGTMHWLIYSSVFVCVLYKKRDVNVR